MSDRIRQLEDALAILQSTLSNDPHPLLNRELLRVKSSIDLHSAVEGAGGGDDMFGGVGGSIGSMMEEEPEESQYIDAFGTLAIRDDGAATFYGRSAGSEVCFSHSLPGVFASLFCAPILTLNAYVSSYFLRLVESTDRMSYPLPVHPEISRFFSFLFSFPSRHLGIACPHRANHQHPRHQAHLNPVYPPPPPSRLPPQAWPHNGISTLPPPPQRPPMLSLFPPPTLNH